MRKVLNGFLVAAAGIGLSCSVAHATHNTPAKAKKLKGEFIRAYAQCSGSGDTITSNGFPACSGAAEPDPCAFGPNGKGKYLFKADPVGDIAFKASLTGLNAACEGLALTLTADFVRWTVDDCAGASCRVIDLNDLPLTPLTSCTVVGGVCQVNSTINTELTSVIVPGKRSAIGIGKVSFFLGISSTRLFMSGLFVP